MWRSQGVQAAVKAPSRDLIPSMQCESSRWRLARIRWVQADEIAFTAVGFKPLAPRGGMIGDEKRALLHRLEDVLGSVIGGSFPAPTSVSTCRGDSDEHYNAVAARIARKERLTRAGSPLGEESLDLRSLAYLA